MKQEFSAGGVVYKRKAGSVKGEVEILVSQHSGHHGWVFPKGFIGDKIEGESKEETALREVKEETGARGEIIEALTPVDYWYQIDEERHHKTVYYFVMKYLDGDITQHDWEMENVEWLPIDEVKNRLTFPSDKKVWREAKAWLMAHGVLHMEK
jgi:8-oxo-dGTP diphosphatase